MQPSEPADHEAQMGDLQAFGDHPMRAIDHVVITVVRKIALEPVGGLARAAATEGIRDDDEVSPGIQRLSVLEQLVGQGRSQPVGAGAGIALQQQHAIDDLACAVAFRRTEGAVVQFELRQGLAADKFVVRDDEVALLVVGPVSVFGLDKRGCGDADKGGEDGTDQHDRALREWFRNDPPIPASKQRS
jgi:hypothetical protein